MRDRRYRVVKTDDSDYAIVYKNDEGETIPQAMNILSVEIANKLCRHLNADHWVNTMYRERKRGDAFVRTPYGFHMNFANGRGASVQWGLKSYCDGGADLRAPLSFFKVQVQDEGARKLMPEFDDDMYIDYEQMYSVWGSPDAEISPGPDGIDVSGYASPEDVAKLLYETSQMASVGEEIEDPLETLREMAKIDLPTTEIPSDEGLIKSVKRWRDGEHEGRHIADWRSHLDAVCNVNIWENLTPLGRAAVFVICEHQADREDWEE